MVIKTNGDKRGDSTVHSGAWEGSSGAPARSRMPVKAVNLRTAWATHRVQGQPTIPSEALSQTNKQASKQTANSQPTKP